MQAGSRLVADFFRRPLFTFLTCSCDRRSSWAPHLDFRWAWYPSRHRLSDPAGRASESEGYVRAGVYRCSSPEHLILSCTAISKQLHTFKSASTSLKTRGGRLPRRCFLAWCTQFQITHVFLEAVLVLRPSNFFKTCESLLTSRLEPGAFTKTHRHRAFDASSFSRVNPLRRRMNRRPLLESVFFAATPPRAFFSRASLARRPQQAEGGARGRRAPLVVHDGALRARPSFYDFPPPSPLSPLTRYDESR